MSALFRLPLSIWLNDVFGSKATINDVRDDDGFHCKQPFGILGHCSASCAWRLFLKEDNMRVLSAACVILGMTGAQAALAEPRVNDLAPRTEVHAIETLTLSDQQLLTGDKNGQRVTIAGELRFPRGTTGRLPVVILLHGSGGIGAREEFWSKYLSELGMASFLVDSFAGRQLTDRLDGIFSRWDGDALCEYDEASGDVEPPRQFCCLYSSLCLV
jgi:hypothetical protein